MIETTLLTVLAVLAVLYVVLLGRLDRAERRAAAAEGVEVLLQAEVRLLEDKLARRDVSLADVCRELEAIRSVLREEETPVGDVRLRLAALNALEDLARRGHGPTFTQGAVHTSTAVATFGPGAEDFPEAILRARAQVGRP